MKYYALSMDDGASFLPEIFEYDSDIPDFFEAVNKPMIPVIRDTWLECFNHMQNHLSVRTVQHDRRLKELSYSMEKVDIDEDDEAHAKLTDIIARIKKVQIENEATQDTMVALVKMYGEKNGDVTQDMLEAVSFLSTRRKDHK